MQNMKIFDGHNDTLLAYYQNNRGNSSFFELNKKGHIDYPRARQAGFAGGFFAIFSANNGHDPMAHLIPTKDGYELPLAPPRDHNLALQDTLAMVSLLLKLERESKGTFKVVRTTAELEHCLHQDIMAAIMHIEGAEALDTDLEILDVLHAAGLRSLGPVWSRQNAFATGVPFSFPKHPDTGDGLNQAGKALIRRCNELGIMIDLSHMNAKGFWDVAALSSKPLVATHSNAHAISASPRNLTDDQLGAIRDSDGMVGLNFSVTFLRPDGKPEDDTPLEVMIQHIDYLVDKLGIERVGFGSDFDGARMPAAIKDVTGLPALTQALKAHGYDDEALEKLCHKNWLRVLKLTWLE